MGLKEDNDASIANMKAVCDTMLPDLPANRINSTNMRTLFGDVFAEMQDISDRTDDAMVSALNGKQDKLSGTPSQYVRGDGSLATLPSPVDVNGKSDKSQFAALSPLATHGQTNGQTNGATNNPTNAPTDAPTNYGLLAAILGSDINTTNSKQNATAANVNTIATNVNSLATKYNELATKFNALITWLTTSQSYQNNIRLAGAT